MRLALAILFLTVVAPAIAQQNTQDRIKSAGEARDRINKVWDERLAMMLRARIESQCKAEAKQAYSAIRFNKRRTFVDECVSKATTAAAQPASHQVH